MFSLFAVYRVSTQKKGLDRAFVEALTGGVEGVMRMVDLFCGAGGLSLGLEQAGFEPVLAVEIAPDACATYRSLFPEVDLREQPIESLDFRPYAGRVDLVAGGPPCQPFSIGGKRLAEGDVRNMLPEFLRAIREINPPLFLMENVPGLTLGDRFDYFQASIDALQGLGYEVVYKVLYAADYGVPQKRRRLFIVGSKIGCFAFPEPTHGPKTSRPYVAAGNILSKHRIIGELNLSPVVYAKNPELRPSPYDGHLFNGGGRPINMDGLCPTILASAGGNKTPFIDSLDQVPRYHSELMANKPPRVGTLPGGRRITVAEAALIQTFPSGTRFQGSRSSQYTQVGNAVPPLLAKQVGLALAALLACANSKVSGL